MKNQTNAQALVDIENRLNTAGLVGANHRLGTELHGKLRRVKKDMDQFGTTDEERSVMQTLTSRMLTEVFEMPDENVVHHDKYAAKAAFGIDPTPEPEPEPLPVNFWTTREARVGLTAIASTLLIGVLFGRITKR